MHLPENTPVQVNYSDIRAHIKAGTSGNVIQKFFDFLAVPRQYNFLKTNAKSLASLADEKKSFKEARDLAANRLGAAATPEATIAGALEQAAVT